MLKKYNLAEPFPQLLDSIQSYSPNLLVGLARFYFCAFNLFIVHTTARKEGHRN